MITEEITVTEQTVLTASKFMVRLTPNEVCALTDTGAIALVQKYNQESDWLHSEAYEYAMTLYLAALAGSVTHDEEMEKLTEECNLRILSGHSGCICGNHSEGDDIWKIC